MKILNAKEFLEGLNIGKLNIRDVKPIRRLPDELVKKYNLTFNFDTCRYDCDGDVEIKKDLVKDGKLITDFGVIKGSFDCYDNKLASLEGCPVKVDGSFNCSKNNLTSLEGCPTEVSGNFSCYKNKLTSLEGCPTEIGGDFVCFSNNLTSLEGCPAKVGGNFLCIFQKAGHEFTKDEIKSLCDVKQEIHV